MENADGAGDERAPTVVGSLRLATRDLHLAAERSGFMRELLRGRGSRAGYILLIRNLWPVYEALERGIQQHADLPAVRTAHDHRLWRAGPLDSDLAQLAGEHWQADVPTLAAGERYAQRIGWATSANPELLLAHAYVRYLGDLSGGQIVRRLLARSLDLGEAALQFHKFAAIEDIEGFKAGYLARLDEAGRAINDRTALVEEAKMAFRLNIELSEAVLRRVDSAAIA